ncbi:MAG: hypothetical protein RLZZ338_4653 [Cyanobacteriota bacterium]|jgi:hypothetical protein
MLSNTEQLTFKVQLSFEAHSLAQKYSKLQSSPQKAKQVYLNILSVYAVDFYLQCMGFETDWPGSDSRNPLMLKLLDLADLDVKQFGKLECRPVLPDQRFCYIPPDVWQDRIGYVAVQLNPSLKEATILGFTNNPMPEFPLIQLQSLDNFLAYMSRIRQPKLVNLRNWFEGSFEEGWQTIKELFTTEQFEFAQSFRSSVSIARGQQIDLGMQLAEQNLALVVTLPPEPDSEINITVQVHPLGNKNYLPQGLILSVLDESESVILEAESRDEDNFIQLGLTAEKGEEFSIKITLGEATIMQNFLF